MVQVQGVLAGGVVRPHIKAQRLGHNAEPRRLSVNVASSLAIIHNATQNVLTVRGCFHHKKKQRGSTSTTPSTDKANIIQICDLNTNLSSSQNHKSPFPFQWLRQENPPHSTVELTLSVCEKDRVDFNWPFRDPTQLRKVLTRATVDSGAMAVAVPLKCMHDMGLKPADLMPFTSRLRGAGGTDLGTIGTFVLSMSALTPTGATVVSKQMAYVCTKVNNIYLSKTVLQDLGIPPAHLKPSITETAEDCQCPHRDSDPPPLVTELPDHLRDCGDDIPNMKQWLLDQYSATVFNTCKHQAMPHMTGDLLRIFMDPQAKPVTVNNPASIPIHWHDKVKRDLDREVRLGDLERVPVNTPSVWCSRMMVTVDMQPQNKWSVRQAYLIEPPFVSASRIPPNQWMSVVDSWNS